MLSGLIALDWSNCAADVFCERILQWEVAVQRYVLGLVQRSGKMVHPHRPPHHGRRCLHQRQAPDKGTSKVYLNFSKPLQRSS